MARWGSITCGFAWTRGRLFHEVGQADEIASEYLNELDAAIKMLLDQGLAVDIDMQADSAWKQRLATSDDFVEEYADFWRALARHWSALDPERVFFEILNEPELRDRYRWSGVQSKLADAIRQGAPRHTIIATGAHWSDDDDLVFLEPLRDNNVIYTFHFYQPQIFTHQGATWSVNYWHYLKGVPYPCRSPKAQKSSRGSARSGEPAGRSALRNGSLELRRASMRRSGRWPTGRRIGA